MAGTRHKARMLALQALYEVDSVARPLEMVTERLLAEANLSQENIEFVRELVGGTIKNREEIDRSIKKFAPAYPVEQLALIDRNILRLAIFEILFDNEVPVKVAVNEAVELAKTFGSETSAKFINGVLGSVSAIAGR
ncbi:MAG: transcription antitermination factor NusB [Chloroflexi bacterium RBG_16_50_11]|nr:MAG: transcription antitermination factor NusB [Chloroflexi bacterium RBG_16_50_11]